MRAPIHSTKHYVQMTLSTVTTGTTLLTPIAVSVAVVNKNVGTEVEEGALVKAVYVEMWCIGTTADQFYTATVEKAVSGELGPTNTELTNLFAYVNKKNIFYTSQGLTGNDGISIPLPIYKGWIKIPKSKQRFGLGDRLVFAIASRGDASLTLCGFFTYKEYT